VSVDFAGFCGPSYQLDNRFASIERLSNWYCVPNESFDEKKFKLALDPCPGNAAFCTLPVPAPFNQPNRNLLELRGTAYGVNGNVVFSIGQNGVFTQIGNVVDDGNPVSMVANGTDQIFIASAGNGYVIPAGGSVLVPIPIGDFLGATYATSQDGYILVATPNSNGFQISGTDDTPLGDARLWSAANVSIQAGQQDYLKAIVSSREYLRLLCGRRSLIYSNVGNNGIGNFPFQSYSQTIIETGIDAPFSLADLGDSLIWIGQDARGRRACWQDHGFQPQRVSNFAVELFWDSYARVDDAVAFPMIWLGHLQYQVTFPSAYIDPVTSNPTGATWIYDVTVSQLLGRPVWFERSFHTALGEIGGRSERFHCYCYGRHLVGSSGLDGNPGAIYQYSAQAYTDCGTDVDGNQVQQPIVRDRIAPHLWQGNKRVIYNRIELEMSRGVGLDGAQFGANPQILIRWSNDGGWNWGPEQSMNMGQIGQFGIRAYYNRCGYARDRVFWIRCSDPVFASILGAELDMTPCAS
jgi:hypothetical protein